MSNRLPEGKPYKLKNKSYRWNFDTIFTKLFDMLLGLVIVKVTINSSEKTKYFVFNLADIYYKDKNCIINYL